MAQQGEVSINRTNGIATVTFHHPKGNSLPGSLLNQLTSSFKELGEKDDARVVVLQSKGDGAFCGGASFTELANISNKEEGKEFFMGFANVVNAMRKCPKLIIARVQGKAVGGGVGLAAAADYTFASHSASIKMSELSLGIGPFVVGPAVKRKIGTSAFSTLSINATTWQTAQWAVENGLFAEIHQTQKELNQAVENLASELSESSPPAMAELKRALWEGTGNWDELLEIRAATSGRLVTSKFSRTIIEQLIQ